jgi:hypothetical protein
MGLWDLVFDCDFIVATTNVLLDVGFVFCVPRPAKVQDDAVSEASKNANAKQEVPVELVTVTVVRLLIPTFVFFLCLLCTGMSVSRISY